MPTTADALLRAVIDRPDDDLPRLAYADYLDEAGDGARATFIRTQVELARLPDHDPARPALEDREHDLLAAHEAEWLGDAGSAVEWHWQRGFVEEVAASPRWMLDHADGLFAAQPARRWRSLPGGPDDRNAFGRAERAWWPSRLEALDLSSADQLVGPGVHFLVHADLDRVRELDLPGSRAVGFMRHTLLRSAPMTDRLEILRLTGDGEWIDFADLAAALARTRLTELAIPNAGMTAAGLSPLLLSPACERLARLDLSDNALGPDGWRAFHGTPCRLRELDLSGTPLGAFALDRVLGCESTSELRNLELNRCGSAMANVRALAGSRYWRQAEDLRMHNGTIPARALDPLFEQADGPPALRALDLSDNYLYDPGVAELAAAPWAGALTWLALSRNYLTDDAARTIATSGGFAHLRTLHLSYNHPNWQEGAEDDAAITEAGVMALAESPALANLRLLVLNGTAMGPAGVSAALNGPHWRLAGLGLARCDLAPDAAGELAASPRLGRLTYLDLSGNPRLGRDTLLPLAESPHLCPLLELDIRGVDASDRVGAALRERLGRRLSE